MSEERTPDERDENLSRSGDRSVENSARTGNSPSSSGKTSKNNEKNAKKPKTGKKAKKPKKGQSAGKPAGAEQQRSEAETKRNRSGPYLLEDLKKKETGMALEHLKALERLLPGNALQQWKRYINEASLPAQTGRKREAGIRTRRLYRERVITALKLLAKLGMRLGNLREFSVKHLNALFAYWEDHGASGATLQNMYTALFRLLVRLGKPAVPVLKQLLKDPSRGEREYVKEEELTFEALGHDKEAFFEAVEAYCPITACQLWSCPRIPGHGLFAI